MQLNDIHVVARHFDLTDALKHYLQQKVQRVLRHFANVLDIMVIMSTEKPRDKSTQHHVELSVHVRGRHVVVKEMHFDMYAAIDLVVHKLDRQLAKYNQMRNTHHHDKREVLQLAAQEEGRMQMT